jgi:hypothetical protein
MKKILYIILLLSVIEKLPAQGCSDAGICTLGSSLKEDQTFDKFSFAINQSLGSAEQKVNVHSTQIEISKSLFKKAQIQLKLPYIFAQGNLANTQGLGDISASFTYQYYQKKDWIINYTLGFKLGVNAADKAFEIQLPANNRMMMALPMVYQTSLGTHDILFGADARYKSVWRFALGFQMPIVQFNKNNFESSLAQYTPNATAYFTSNKLMRRPDALLRIDRSFAVHKRFQANAGLIAVYHLLHDRVYNASNTASYAVHGSKGLTLNYAISGTYIINKHFELSCRFAQPLIVRKTRPEGLTRHYVIGLELKYRLPSYKIIKSHL